MVDFQRGSERKLRNITTSAVLLFENQLIVDFQREMVTETPSPPKAFTKSDQWLDLVKAFEHRDVIAAKAFTKSDQWLVLVKRMRGYRGRWYRGRYRSENIRSGGPAGRAG